MKMNILDSSDDKSQVKINQLNNSINSAISDIFIKTYIVNFLSLFIVYSLIK